VLAAWVLVGAICGVATVLSFVERAAHSRLLQDVGTRRNPVIVPKEGAKGQIWSASIDHGDGGYAAGWCTLGSPPSLGAAQGPLRFRQ